MVVGWLNGFYGVADFEGAAAGYVGEHAALAFYFGAQAVSDALDEGTGFAARWFPPSVAMPDCHAWIHRTRRLLPHTHKIRLETALFNGLVP